MKPGGLENRVSSGKKRVLTGARPAHGIRGREKPPAGFLLPPDPCGRSTLRLQAVPYRKRVPLVAPVAPLAVRTRRRERTARSKDKYSRKAHLLFDTQHMARWVSCSGLGSTLADLRPKARPYSALTPDSRFCHEGSKTQATTIPVSIVYGFCPMGATARCRRSLYVLGFPSTDGVSRLDAIARNWVPWRLSA